jgi:class 3 adenylate cyclase
MTRRPETKYAWNGDVALAYQVFGEGPVDIVYLQGMISNLDLNWESAYLSRFLTGLAGLGRLIVTDRRGWGCSDRFSPDAIPPLELLTDDLLAVMDAAETERPVLFATFEHTALALMFAASHPDRLSSLVLCDPQPVWLCTAETPWMPSEQQWDEILADVHEQWGTDRWTEPPSPFARMPVERDWCTRMQRATLTPGSIVAEFYRYMRTDVREVLPSVHVPTLVLSLITAVDDDEFDMLSVENGRLLASRIANARVVEMDVSDRFPWYHWYERAEPILEELGRFIAERREEAASLDRVLATVLFSDIVDSTAVAARLGDAGWRELVERHHATVRSLLARYRGKEADTAGDGFFATFDGPARAVTCAKAIVEAVRPLGIEVRVGVHTGEVETIDGKAGGLAVVIGSRVGALAGASEVLASQTVKDLTVGSGLAFEGSGEHELKGVPGAWRLYAVA